MSADDRLFGNLYGFQLNATHILSCSNSRIQQTSVIRSISLSSQTAKHNIYMKIIDCHNPMLILIAYISISGIACGQDFGNSTAGEVLSKATSSVNDLKTAKGELDLNLGINASVDANVNVTANGLIEKMDGLIDNLKDSLKNDLGKPIQSLSDNLRESFAQLDSTTKAIDVILSRQRHGFAQDLGVLAAQLQTTALEFDQNIPLVGKPGSPRIFYFAFDGSPINVVPKNGGWCNVTGFGLWDNATPRVDILDDSKETVIATPRVKRGNGNNQISISLPNTFVKSNIGKVVYLRITPIKSEGHLFWKHTKDLDPLFTALMIPEDFNTKVVFKAYFSAKIPATKRRQLSTQNARFDNASCEHQLDVSRRLTWTTNPGGKITDMGARQSQVRDSTWVNYTISGNDSIVISGKIDTADCVQVSGPFGIGHIAHLNHTTIWSYDFTPTEEFPDQEEQITTNSSPGNLVDSNPQVSVEVPATIQSDDNVMWCEVVFIDGKKERKVFESPREIANPIARRTYSFQNYSLAVQFNARVTAGTSEADLALTKTEVTN